MLQPSDVNNIQKVATLHFDYKIWGKKINAFLYKIQFLLVEGNGNVSPLPFFVAVSGWILKRQHR